MKLNSKLLCFLLIFIENIRINIRTSALEETTIGAIDENITDTSNDLTKPSDGVYYAVSDLAVGGRCKCQCKHLSINLFLNYI